MTKLLRRLKAREWGYALAALIFIIAQVWMDLNKRCLSRACGPYNGHFLPCLNFNGKVMDDGFIGAKEGKVL